MDVVVGYWRKAMEGCTRSSRVALLLFVSIAVLWPALYNGQPFYFSDTSAYIRGADAGVQKLTGIATAWTQPRGSSSTGTGEAPVTELRGVHESLSSIEDKAVISGRSVYYGALLYLGYLGGEFWLAVAIQAVLLASALAFTLRACNLTRWPYVATTVAVICVTPAPFFSSFLMPDVFAPLAILACAVLVVAGGSLGKSDRLFWFALLTFSLLTHSANLLVIGGMLVAVLALRLVGKPYGAARAGTVLVAVSLALGLVSEFAFNLAVTRVLGAAPLRPPFLMARTIADGPGYRYILATCPANGFTVCRFADRLPLSADEFLWVRDSTRGVFATSDAETKRLLSEEQFRFFTSVLAFDPWGQARASIGNAFKQASMLGLQEFAYPLKRRTEFSAKLPGEVFARMQNTAAYKESIPLRWWSFLSYMLAAAGLGYIVWVAAWERLRSEPSRLTSLRIAWCIVTGILVNAMVCGAFSTPHHRYQARVIWLLPFIALAIDFERRGKWWERMHASVFARVKGRGPSL